MAILSIPLPCPFCGNSPQTRQTPERTWIFRCESCNLDTREELYYVELLNWWNQRTADDSPSELCVYPFSPLSFLAVFYG